LFHIKQQIPWQMTNSIARCKKCACHKIPLVCWNVHVWCIYRIDYSSVTVVLCRKWNTARGRRSFRHKSSCKQCLPA